MKIKLTWNEVLERLEKYDKSHEIIYGVPKGGMIITAFLKNAKATFDVNRATLILDDLIDSGATKQKYEDTYHLTPFVALYDKIKEGITDWLIFPWESDHPQGEDNVQENIIRLLQYIGEDVKREGLLKTPYRVVKSWNEIFCGYSQKEEDLFTKFEADGYDQIVLLKDIELYSMCEHHMLPFFGKVHVAYIPDKKVIGISKLARLVDMYARRLQIQERIGQQVTDALMKNLQPLGAACIIEATHMCMRMRGVAKQNSTMITSSITGVFRDNSDAKDELMQLIRK